MTTEYTLSRALEDYPLLNLPQGCRTAQAWRVALCRELIQVSAVSSSKKPMTAGRCRDILARFGDEFDGGGDFFLLTGDVILALLLENREAVESPLLFPDPRFNIKITKKGVCEHLHNILVSIDYQCEQLQWHLWNDPEGMAHLATHPLLMLKTDRERLAYHFGMRNADL